MSQPSVEVLQCEDYGDDGGENNNDDSFLEEGRRQLEEGGGEKKQQRSCRPCRCTLVLAMWIFNAVAVGGALAFFFYLLSKATW